MVEARERLIELIHTSGFQAALVVCGGGSGAVHALLSHSGASRFVVEAQVPYSAEALAAYLGASPAQACSEPSVRAMAAKALEHAVELGGKNPLGIACTAALQTNRVRRGSDRAFLCFQSLEKLFFQRVEFPAGSRAEQELFLSNRMLSDLAIFLAEPEP